MRPRSLRPLEKGLIAYVVVLALLLALTFGVNALVRCTNRHVRPHHRTPRCCYRRWLP